MIPVTKTFLPPINEYQKYLQEIWKSNQLANGGKLLFDLQRDVQNFLNVPYMLPTANGTLPIQIALKLLANRGEVITTPFSYIATTSAIIWEGCTPVFVDIHPEYLTIDETKIEAAITSKTTAILATHVFGNPCNVTEIGRIAKKHDLKVIYDAAHCFGVNYQGKSIFSFGDVSTCSFHATKIFQTGEGGAMFTADPDLYHKFFYSHNFGHNGELAFFGLGINAKMSELQAAMGLAVLPYVGEVITKRKQVVDQYNTDIDFSRLQKIILREGTDWNYSYYPIIFEDEETLIKVKHKLNEKEVYPRRYFHTSLNTLDYVNYKEMPISESIAKRILCLPLAHNFKRKELELIIRELNLEIC